MNAVLEQRSKLTMPERTSAAASAVTYTASIGLVLGKGLDFLNANAAACGVILGIITLIVNMYFKRVIMNHYKDNGMRRRRTDFENLD